MTSKTRNVRRGAGGGFYSESASCLVQRPSCGARHEGRWAKNPNVVTVHPTAMVTAAAERMATENVGALVVVEHHKPVGIVTDRDLVVRTLAKRLPPHQTEVGAVMTPNPICVTEDAPLESAIEYIKFHRIRRLVVLNKAQEVGGIITLDDILELLAEERQALEAVTGVMRVMRHERL
jgi:CBS domain-containing protein